MNKILIIEDDKWISASLKLYLENSNYTTSLYFEWLNAINEIKKVNPDLIILDINLPWKDWIKITKELREFSKIPIVMLTARSSEFDRIKWLEIWADDYIAKPFSPRELLARINIILRRVWEKETNDIIKDTFWVELDIAKKIVKVDWKKISLTWNEYDILRKLLDEKWKIVTRETIMTEIIWYDKYVYDRTIDTHIKNLRKKIWKKDYIITVRWEWYRINI
jgi:two-component system alkaline phosphatase synthesis response regulator PhoP